MEKVDKRDRAPQFRARLAEAMANRKLSQAELARQTGVDRSTISALLQPGIRLPNAQLAADCARALGISADWLLGLSGRPEPIADLLAASLSLTEAPRALIDERIFGWHQEAAGYKIRHVPATLPDMLKTRAMQNGNMSRNWAELPNRRSGLSRTDCNGCVGRGRTTRSRCRCMS